MQSAAYSPYAPLGCYMTLFGVQLLALKSATGFIDRSTDRSRSQFGVFRNQNLVGLEQAV